MTQTAKHFDYLAEYDADLEAALGVQNLSKDIEYWRRSGMEHPDSALLGCRKTVELSLKKLADPLPDERMDLRETIDYANDEGVIDGTISLKCHEIRRLGNRGAHKSTKAIDAQMALDLLDDYLRWNAVKLGLIPAFDNGAAPCGDPIFIVRPEEEVAEMARKAKLAAALDDNKTIRKRAKKAKEQVAAFDESSKSDLEKMANLLLQAEEIGASATARKDKSVLAAQEKLLVKCDKNLEILQAEKTAIDENLDTLNTEIQEILSEHDFVRRLLHGDKRATERQLNVMAFPRGSNSVTNILQISGVAGTGKTLCLLAKIISEIDDHGQESLFGDPKKKALFVCFNKGLANYVRSILAGYDGNLPDIEVANYDMFVNQLVRNRPKAGYEHLADYAQDARYSSSSIIYGSNEDYEQLLRKAQEEVAKLHPDQANSYYLDPSGDDELQWLKDEIAWIEARYMTDADAERGYPREARTGRGTKRLPNEAVRKVILEIRRELNGLLEANGRYTIEQATKRVLNSRDDLPAYDAIAIDEVQDFSLQSIRLLLRFRRSDKSKVFISGDENQKIYRRDFTWKQLDEGLKGHTITLEKNMRNSAAIRRFSDRLLGANCSYASASRFVYVEDADDEKTVELLRKLSDPNRQESTALIGSVNYWSPKLKSERVAVVRSKPGAILEPGLYLIGNLQGKGLEFDNVVVDYSSEAGEDEEEEKRLRYVHFTRARKRLYVRYQGEPPKLLTEYYADFLGS